MADLQIISSGTVTTLLSLTEPQMVNFVARNTGQTIAHSKSCDGSINGAHGLSPT